MLKMFVTLILVLSISMLTQSAPAADPAPAPCSSVPEEICEIETEFTGGGQPIFAQRCRIEFRVVGDCGN